MAGSRSPNAPLQPGGDVPPYPPLLWMAEMLQLLAERGHARNVDDLVELAVAAGFPELAAIVERHRDKPMDLALRFLGPEAEAEAFRTWSMLDETLAGGRVGLLFPPFPDHLLDRLSRYGPDLLLPAGSTELPSRPRHSSCCRHQGFLSCREAALACDAIAFEAYRDAAGYHVRPWVVEILDVLESGRHDRPLLLVHPRLQSFPDEQQLAVDRPIILI